jgi:NAD(P)-dependent dehydrogenase (short-subunit alcohol dehydrogenase family)
MNHNEFASAAVVLIGGHLGVGPAVVRAFHEGGARVALGVVTGQALTDAQRSACDLPGVAQFAIDPSDPQSVSGFFDQCEAALGGLAVLVNVAPPVRTQAALDIAPAEYRRVVDAELVSPILCMLEAARRMTPRGTGRIIAFASMSGKTGTHKLVAPYAAAKGGLITFSRVLAAELAPSGVTVNVIATALFDVQVSAGSEHLTEVLKGIPVGRVGRSAEAARAVLYLASADAGYVTGETLNLSGGRFMD